MYRNNIHTQNSGKVQHEPQIKTVQNVTHYHFFKIKLCDDAQLSGYIACKALCVCVYYQPKIFTTKFTNSLFHVTFIVKLYLIPVQFFCGLTAMHIFFF